MVLGHEHVLLAAVPAARPGLIGPAESEWQVRLPILEHQLKGPLQQPTAAEPVEVVAEAIDAVLSGELCLCRARITREQIVGAQLTGQVRNRVPRIQRLRGRHVLPVGEALPPPGIVLWDTVVLGQVESHDCG